MLWERIRTSLWFVPGLVTALAGALATFTVWLDRQVDPDVREVWFLFSTGAEGARGVLSTIAGSIITVTAVVFSITIVVLQLASSQFSPRVLRSFTRDRVTQLVLGVFIGTFTYALLVLRSVRSQVEDYNRFVPAISVSLCVLLALISVGFLIFFIHHIARSIQAEVIVERVTRDALHTAHEMLPQRATGDGPGAVRLQLRERGARVVHTVRSGYIQRVEIEALMRVAQQHGLQLTFDRRIGDFVVESEALLQLAPPTASEQAVTQVRNAVGIGPDRTGEQDLGRGIIELSDIGVRALSPGINDPTTAIVCIDRLFEVMCDLLQRDFAPLLRRSDDGEIRLFMNLPDFAELVRLGYGRLRHYGAGHPAVALRLAESLAALQQRAGADDQSAVAAEFATLMAAARDHLSGPDLDRIEELAAAIREPTSH